MTDPIYPLVFAWDGEVMRPASLKRADRQYVVGETYRLAPVEERSPRSHNHYFACIQEAWRNLPEDLAARFPTMDHLRKWALIKAGYRSERSIVFDSPGAAEKAAHLARGMDDFAVVVVSGNMVTVYEAESQSTRAMKKQRFQQSKDAVLDILAQMIEVDRPTLESNAGRAA